MFRDTIVPPELTIGAPPAARWPDRLARRAVHQALARLSAGRLILDDAGQTCCFGDAAAAPEDTARVTVHHPAMYRAVALGGSLGAGEAYVRGHWTSAALTTLIRLLIRNEACLRQLDSGWNRLTAPLRRVLHGLRDNTLNGSRRNVAAHYDLSNDFYGLFLDETLSYSAGIFTDSGASLYDASVAKLERVCRKLALTPEDHLLEIGTGWGGLAIHAARTYGCRVTTTTISRAQHELACARVRAAGLDERVRVLAQDYRELSGEFDKLVSIEMIEAVGDRHYDDFFAQCSRRLRPSGMMLLQAITMPDRYYERARREVDFIKRYVFPGSCIPALAPMTASIGRSTDLAVVHLEDLTPHYATTLVHWRERFLAQRAAVRALGFPESFIRLWHYYLCYCEAGFRERTIGNVQMLLHKPACRQAAPLPRLD